MQRHSPAQSKAQRPAKIARTQAARTKSARSFTNRAHRVAATRRNVSSSAAMTKSVVNVPRAKIHNKKQPQVSAILGMQWGDEVCLFNYICYSIFPNQCLSFHFVFSSDDTAFIFSLLVILIGTFLITYNFFQTSITTLLTYISLFIPFVHFAVVFLSHIH